MIIIRTLILNKTSKLGDKPWSDTTLEWATKNSQMIFSFDVSSNESSGKSIIYSEEGYSIYSYNSTVNVIMDALNGGAYLDSFDLNYALNSKLISVDSILYQLEYDAEGELATKESNSNFLEYSYNEYYNFNVLIIELENEKSIYFGTEDDLNQFKN